MQLVQAVRGWSDLQVARRVNFSSPRRLPEGCKRSAGRGFKCGFQTASGLSEANVEWLSNAVPRVSKSGLQDLQGLIKRWATSHAQPLAAYIYGDLMKEVPTHLSLRPGSLFIRGLS